MRQKIEFGKSVIEYDVIKSRRSKTSQISVDKDNVIVRTPVSKTDSEIEAIIKGKSKWIFKKQLEFSDLKKRKKIKTKEKTSAYLERRTWKLASKINVTPSKVVVKNMKSRWGSAGKTGKITLNQALTKAPPRIIDYIIIHELCHLKINDHSRKFWNLVHLYDKNFEDKIKWLEENKLN